MYAVFTYVDGVYNLCEEFSQHYLGSRITSIHLSPFSFYYISILVFFLNRKGGMDWKTLLQLFLYY